MVDFIMANGYQMLNLPNLTPSKISRYMVYFNERLTPSQGIFVYFSPNFKQWMEMTSGKRSS